MVIDGILDLFFSLCGGIDFFYLACATIILAAFISAIVRHFHNV